VVAREKQKRAVWLPNRMAKAESGLDVAERFAFAGLLFYE
jgi:hypothetical protein